MTEIRMELREDEVTCEADLWVNLEDVLTWLDLLPTLTRHRVAADVSGQIRQMLYDAAVTPSEPSAVISATR
jgi:hypothetical protein